MYILNKISEELLENKSEIYSKGIWEYLIKYKTKDFDLTTKHNKFKEFNSIMQPINLLKNNNIFCVKYFSVEGCTLCNLPKKKDNFYSPCIEINYEDIINDSSLNDKFNSLFVNSYYTCLNCGYDENDNIINQNTCYKIISEILYPEFLFVAFEFINETEKELKNIYEEEKLGYDIRIKNNDLIIKYLLKDQKINNITYKLAGIITTPESDHYTSIIISLNNEIRNLKKSKNYYHDGMSKYHDIEEIDNIEDFLKRENPYIALYIKI